ncbi:TATA box-binding protein-associated factor RNA polymerase I subunit D [Microcaecilia unicolor]|uniref:TATA box-binding protein-associated factor RNA polymerase I subunit D n=1 Tax=Microcaecilia unicolor TaxID=1415580 RepID=A0A6P7WFK8_9AMPH|nr:TATA box-binding protein-associated factor RNA polymerase I subunit D [Microcaecilia unicolor]
MDEEESLINAHENIQTLEPLSEEELRAGKDKAKHVDSDNSQDEEILDALRSECSCVDSSSTVTLLPASSSTVSQDLDSDSSGSSLFLTQCTLTPQRAARKRKSASCVSRSSTPAPHEDSTGSSSEPIPQPTWRQLFYEHFRKKKYTKRKKKKYKRKKKKKKRTGRPIGRPCLSTPLQQQRQLKDKVLQFPFVAKEELPFRMTLTCEQAAVSGLFQYMEKLKCKRHLQTSLCNMDKSEELEEEFEVHKYKYLDEDGPISPIQEPNKELDPREPDDYDAKVVENSCFILSSYLPKQNKVQEEENISGTG